MGGMRTAHACIGRASRVAAAAVTAPVANIMTESEGRPCLLNWNCEAAKVDVRRPSTRGGRGGDFLACDVQLRRDSRTKRLQALPSFWSLRVNKVDLG